MFLAYVFIVLGLFMFLNALGIISGNFWGLFWAVIFITIGFRLLTKKGKCPMCEKMFGNKDCCGHKHQGEMEKENREQN